MVPKPNATKEKLLKLMADKDKLEAKINENGDILKMNDNVGMTGPLVDIEGFPRNDIDVYRVRQARHQIICMQNDHKEIMKQIEKLIHKLHSEAAEDNQHDQRSGLEIETSEMHLDEGASSTNGTEHVNGSTSVVHAIAEINLVSPGSPAEDAGLCIGDQILEFGTVNSKNFKKNLNEIGAIVRHMQNQRIPMKVKRNDKILDITLIPKTWCGRGLLGCNIVLV